MAVIQIEEFSADKISKLIISATSDNNSVSGAMLWALEQTT
jgi:hypothetical protein